MTTRPPSLRTTAALDAAATMAAGIANNQPTPAAPTDADRLGATSSALAALCHFRDGRTVDGRVALHRLSDADLEQFAHAAGQLAEHACGILADRVATPRTVG